MGSVSVRIPFVKIYQYIFFRRKLSLYIKGISAASRKALTLEGCRSIRMCIVSVCKPYKHIAALIAVISVYGNRNAFRICCECFGGNADAVPFRFRFYRKGCAGVIIRFIFIINIIDIRNNHIPCYQSFCNRDFYSIPTDNRPFTADRNGVSIYISISFFICFI